MYKMTKKMIIDQVVSYVSYHYNMSIQGITYIEDTPETIRHSCYQTGFIKLPVNVCRIPNEYGMIDVPFYICQVCGMLYIYKEHLL